MPDTHKVLNKVPCCITFIIIIIIFQKEYWGFPSGSGVKNLPVVQEPQEMRFDPQVGKITRRRACNLLMPGESMDRGAWQQSTGSQRVGLD